MDGEEGQSMPKVVIPEAIVRLKKKIYDEMREAFRLSGKTLKNLFAAVDDD